MRSKAAESDADMKIAGATKKSPPAEDSMEQLVEEIKEDTRTGKLEKVRQLGENIAKTVCDGLIEVPEEFQSLWNSQTETQARLLLAFAVSAGLDEVTSSELTAQIALSVFYNTLQENCPALYDSLNSSAAISMYYLVFRRGKNVDENIGRTFASLCGQENNQAYCKLGKTLYLHFLAMIYREASRFDLAKDWEEPPHAQ